MIKKLSFEEIKASRPLPDTLSAARRFPVTFLLENIRSLYNVGSIFRTADGALLEKLYLCGYTGFPPRREIDKTALGSTQSVPWGYHADAREAANGLRGEGYQLIALEHTNRSVDYTKAAYRFPLCLIMGNEVEGVTEEMVALCDMAVEIPMYGIKQSLNVAVAGGVMAYYLINLYNSTHRAG